MRSQRLIASILFLLLIGIVPVVSQAQPGPAETLTVTISGGGMSEPVELTASGAAAVNLDLNSAGAARTYGNFTIARCGGSGCSGGRARVFVSDGAVDTLVLTDALIRNAGTTTQTLFLSINSGPYTELVQAALYPYAIELNGSFIAGPPQPVGTPPNRIIVTAHACWTAFGGETVECNQIDSPVDDPSENELDANFSIIAPPHKPAGTLQFSPKETQDHQCGPGESSEATCNPFLRLEISITLRPGASARLPGSIGVHHVNTPTDQGGAAIMADLFASLGPKGAEVYEVRLEPSPGADQSLDFRSWAENSPDAWRSRRGEGHGDDDDDNGGGAGASVSATKARLLNNGTGHVRAKGLCPVTGCLPVSMAELPVRVFCGQTVAFTTVLKLNSKGDGVADLAFSLPCNDPGVLIMDPADTYWVAAPVIF